VVVDTNVIVSGLLSPAGPPARVVDLITTARLTVLHDDRILAEYREVLSRPRFPFDPFEVTALVDVVAADGELVVPPPLTIELPDPKDLPFLEVAVAGHAAALITGNERHFVPRSGRHPIRTCKPAEFLQIWSREHA
jgi:putative PIN family toxin of toxin-antitoxin system